MDNCITTARECEEEFNGYVKRMVAGLGKVEAKFAAQMITGINKSSSVILSEIARKSVKGVSVKKSVERFSRRLSVIDAKGIWDNYRAETAELFNDSRIYIMDDTEIVKPMSKRMEGLGTVPDGSDDNILKPGYFVNEIVAINKKWQPVSVSTKLYTAWEKKFESANNIRNEAVKEVIKNYGSGLFVCDRGFDDVKFFNLLSDLHQKFIIRCRSNRDVVDAGETVNIYDSAKRLKGKYAFSIKFQDGLKDRLKASYKEVRLPKMPVPLNLVVVYGFHEDDGEPFYLLTNNPIKDKEGCLNIVRAYLSRWKIEEYFKFKKQAYSFEKIRLLKLNALKNLNVFLTVAMGFLASLSLSKISKRIIELSEPIRKKAAFIYYRLFAGLHTILHDFKADILALIFPEKPKFLIFHQRDFFHYLRYIKNRSNVCQIQNGEI